MTGRTHTGPAGPGGSGVAAPFDVSTDLGRDLAAVDWDDTPLGAPEAWPTSLRNVVGLQLASRFAMWMAWGPDLTFFCNDAYRLNTLGAKYPWALGRPAHEVWAEIWPDIGPRIESVVTTGQATWDEDLLLFLERSGYQEETYHTFSYSPITDDAGAIAGMLCVVSEETKRVIGERRMAILRDLGGALAGARTTAEVCAAAEQLLQRAPRDVPFAAGYLYDGDVATLALAAGIAAGHPLAPFTTAPVSTQATVDVGSTGTDVPSGAWPDPPRQAVVVPFAQPGRREPLGHLVAAVNPFRKLDEEYLGFLDLLAGQIAAALTRARAFEQERERAEKLAELDRDKTAFFTNVSHELRTPLTLLLGPAGDALDDAAHPLPGPQLGRVELIRRNGERLLKLVNTLLDFSRMEAGRQQAHYESIDLARYTSDLAAMFDSATTRAGLTLTVDCAPLPEPVYVDREMWAKVVLNLVSNALKATFEGGVTVALHPTPSGAELTVRDTGVGIPESEQGRLFERFHRVGGARLRSHEGSGIGLALVAELVGLHGGAVEVDSRVGAGSTFTVRVPFGSGHLPPEEVHRTDQAFTHVEVGQYGAGYLAEASRWLTPDAGTAAPEPDDGAPDARPRVLVVDDNPDMRGYVAGLLDGDYAVTVAADGEEALQLARTSPPDLVLTDVMMPRLDGFGLLEAVRADPALLHLPVVMLSARSGEDAAVVGLEAGADDYLVKPFTARELLARVRANLELDRVRRVAQELARSRALLDQAEELAHVGSWQIDLADQSMVGSPEYFRLLGVPEDHLATGGLELAVQSVHPDERELLQEALERTMTDGVPLDTEVRVVHPDGRIRLLRARARRHHGADGAPGRVSGSAQDITEQRLAEAAVATAATARELAAREHAIADELQRSLLPVTAPRTPALDVAAYYAAGVAGTQAGGDWYDVIDLGDERTALVIGDVMGRGVRAAAVMGQLRAGVRAYARVDLPPDRLLRLLDDTVRDASDPTIVTCVYAVHDARARTLTYGNAGHVPPLLSAPGEPARRLTVGDPPLGTGGYRGRTETVPWPPGSQLVLYTDGLVEHRGRDIDSGIDQLAAVLATTDAPVEALPDELVAALLPHEPDDDVAVLAVVDAVWPRLTRPVAAQHAAVAPVRAAATAALADWGVTGEPAMDLLLVVSELVTNAVRYGTSPIEFCLRRGPASVVVEVSDADPVLPRMRHADPAASNGRGLTIVAALSRRWGTRPTGAGKSVWCEVPTP